MTHKEFALDYMKRHVGMTSMDAFRHDGNTRLAASIFELRQDGYNIATIKRESVGHNGRKTHFAEYRLVEK